MSDQIAQSLAAVDATQLTPLVRQSLGHPTAQLLDWQYAPLTGGAAQPEEGVLGRIRFFGHAQIDQRIEPWSLALKIFARPQEIAPLPPSHLSYWQREVLAYRSGILDNLPPGIVAPRAFAIEEYPNDATWVWMEFIHDAYPRWSLPQYALAAHSLGQFNGAYLAGRPTPTADWLSIGSFRTWFSWATDGFPRLHDLAHHPRSWLTSADVEATLHLTSHHERLLSSLEALPQCFCHHDAFRRNLMLRHTPDGDTQTVAIDWAACGPGAVGEDLASLVGLSLYFLETDATDIANLDATVFTSYLAGLRAAGWHGDERLVRLGYTAAAGLFIASTIPGFLLPRIENAEEMSSWDHLYGGPHWIDANRLTHRYGLALGQEALALLATLHL